MTDRPWTSPDTTMEADIRLSLDGALCPQRAGDAALLERVKGRVLAAVTGKSGELHGTVRAQEGTWERLAPGVERKLLWQSADAFSCLMRLAPGASVAGHAHPIDEECVVLEGTLRIDGLVLHAGDFHVGVKGVAHASASTDTGVLVYLRGAREPEAQAS
jgi:hypothetical protein